MHSMTSFLNDEYSSRTSFTGKQSSSEQVDTWSLRETSVCSNITEAFDVNPKTGTLGEPVRNCKISDNFNVTLDTSSVSVHKTVVCASPASTSE